MRHFGWRIILSVYEGQAGDEEYQTLTQGETIPLIWYQVTEENMTAVLE